MRQNELLSIAIDGARSLAPSNVMHVLPDALVARPDVQTLRAMVARTMERPTKSANLNILARALARQEAQVEELVRFAESKTRHGYAANVLATADAVYAALQFTIAESQGRPALYCGICGGALKSPTDCAVERDDFGTKTLIHCVEAECGRGIVEGVA